MTSTKQRKENRIGLNAAIKIMTKWGCTTSEISDILTINKSLLQNQNSNKDINLNNVQLNNISHILNIHAALRTIFSNPDNIYGFMSFKNHNKPFNGSSPLHYIKNHKSNGLMHIQYGLQCLLDNN